MLMAKQNILLEDSPEIVFDQNKIEAKTVLKKKTSPKKLFKKELRCKTAKEVIGKLEKDTSIFGFTKGQFSLIELIGAILEQTGQADIVLSTWTAAGSDLTEAFEFLNSGKIKSIKFVLDSTFQRRKPAFAAKIRELFGFDSIRVTKNHAKFCLIRNGKWDIVLRTSMNLNYNPRFENFELDDDPVFANFLQEIIDEIFNKVSRQNLYGNSSLSEKVFKKL